MKIYDTHVHYLWRSSTSKHNVDFQPLRAVGLQGMALIIMGHHLGEMDRCFTYIPRSYHDKIDQGIFSDSSLNEVPAADLFPDIEIFPYLDSRYITETEADLSRFKREGFRGLKLLYVADIEKDLKMTGWPVLFGKTAADFEKLTLSMIEQAVGFDWPIIFHADLRLHEGFVREVLTTFSGHPFIFPHFGFSRKIMARLIEQFAHCHTDFSSLLPFMQKAPDAYRDFIETYADRVLFGSDATSDWPELILEYIKFVKTLICDEVILGKVLQDNYLKLHCRS
jgi:hypothetical protein